MANIRGDFLAAAVLADEKRRKIALRILNGEISVNPNSGQPLLLKAGSAARYLGISKPTFWRMVQKGHLKPVEITKKATFFRRRDIEKLVEQGGPA